MITAAVFELDNVLVDWDSRYLYRRLFAGDEVAMERFLPEVCTPEWNAQQNLGRSFVEAENELIVRHPEKAEFICVWRLHYDATMKDAIEGSVAILAELREREVPLYALTNWSAETFLIARKRFSFLEWFAGIVVSGEEKIAIRRICGKA